MAMEIKKPQRQNIGAVDALGAAGSIGGAIANPNPASIAGAAATGLNLLSNKNNVDKQVPQAAQRRLQQVQAPQVQQQVEDPLAALAEAQSALKQLPPELQQEFGPALNAGTAAYRRKLA